MSISSGIMNGGHGGPGTSRPTFTGGVGVSGGGVPGVGSFGNSRNRSPIQTSTETTQVPVQTTPPNTQPPKPTSTGGGGTSLSTVGGGGGNQGNAPSTTPLAGGGGSDSSNTAPNKGDTPGGNSSTGSSVVPPLPLITTTKDGVVVTLSLSVFNGGTVVVTVDPSASPTRFGSTVNSERNRIPVGLIVGVLFSGIFVTVGVIFSILCLKRRRRGKDPGVVAFTRASEKNGDMPPPFEEYASHPSANSNSPASVTGSDVLLLPDGDSGAISPQDHELQLSDQDHDNFSCNPPRYVSIYGNSDLESVTFNPVRNVTALSAGSSDMYTPRIDVWTATRPIEHTSIDYRLQPNR